MTSIDVVKGLAVYLRSMHGPHTAASVVERAAMQFTKRASAMGLSWVAIGAVWQQPSEDHKSIVTRFLNTPEECRIYSKVLRDAGITSYVWGYPWIGHEQQFCDGMFECSDSDLYLLDPELGMNPKRSKEPAVMAESNESARLLVRGLRVHGAKHIGLSTFGGIPSWFPLEAFLSAGVDFAGGQTYSDDTTIDTSIASYLARFVRVEHTAQLVPNFGLYARNADGTARSKTPAELRAHLEEFVNEGEPVRAMIGWAENFLTPALEHVLSEFAPRLR